MYIERVLHKQNKSTSVKSGRFRARSDDPELLPGPSDVP